MPEILCAKCGKMMKVIKNGVTVRYGLYQGYFRADLYECPQCGIQVISGLSDEIFDPDKEVDYDFSEMDEKTAKRLLALVLGLMAISS